MSATVSTAIRSVHGEEVDIFCDNPPMHYILFYDVVPDYVERRAQFREAHLKQAQAAVNGGELVLAGALSDPTDTAMIVFTSESAAEAFAKADPYVANGLVKAWRVRKWNTVVGDRALLK